MIRRLVPAWLAQRFTARKCPSVHRPGSPEWGPCPEPDVTGMNFHTHHLTAFGRWLYTK